MRPFEHSWSAPFVHRAGLGIVAEVTMLVNCYAGSAAHQLGYRYQINAATLEDAIHDFARRERVRPTHLRRRPGLLLAFRKGTKYFWVVYPHGREPDRLWPKSGGSPRR